MALQIIHSITLKAEHHLEKLNPNQTDLWNKLYPDPARITPIERHNIKPENLKEFLSNLWMAEIEYDDEGTVTTLKIRLIGTSLVPHYGEVTGKVLIEDFDTTDFQKQYPTFYERLKQISSDMVRAEAPLFASTVYHGDDETQINGTGLVFPMRRNSDNINMVFGFTELATSKMSTKSA